MWQDLLKSFEISTTTKYILKILDYLEDNWRRLHYHKEEYNKRKAQNKA